MRNTSAVLKIGIVGCLLGWSHAANSGGAGAPVDLDTGQRTPGVAGREQRAGRFGQRSLLASHAAAATGQ
jgi:hypothetical protein